jgi:type II secretion system (T2SS) protein G
MAAPAKRTTCVYCSAELEPFASAVRGLCKECLARVLPENGPKPAARKEPERCESVVTRRVIPLDEALARLVARGPASEAPKLVGELLAADKRLSTFLALTPFIGPWLVHRSEAHTAPEKRVLTWISILLAALVMAALIAMLPSPDGRLELLQQRIESEMEVLAAFADQYYAQHRAYPEPSTWRHHAERADPRFYDPWGRPYGYERADGGITLRTLGRDGAEGGSGEDADRSTSLDAGSPRMAGRKMLRAGSRGGS